MPSGKNHLKAEIAALAAIIAITVGANFAFELANWEDESRPLALVFSVAYLFSALLLYPDLDLAPVPTRTTAGATCASAGSPTPSSSATAGSRTTPLSVPSAACST